MGKRLGDPRRPAARLGPLRREVLDAGDDGHGPQPRPQRRAPSRDSRARPTTAASRSTRTAASSRCTGASCSASTARAFDEAFDKAKADVGHDERRGRARRAARRRSSTSSRRSSSTSTGRAVPPGPRRPAPGRDRGRLLELGRRPRGRVPRARGDPARPRHRRQRPGDGLRQPRRPLRHRRRVHPRPRDRPARCVRRLPRQRPGRGRRRGDPAHRAAERDAPQVPQGPRRAARDLRPPRAALPGHVRHGVHDRAGPALDAADPRRQAHRARRAADGRRDDAARATCGSRVAEAVAGSPRTTSTRCCTRSSSPGRPAAIAKGLGASPGAAVGRCYFTRSTTPYDAAARGEHVLLVRPETSPEDVRGMLAAAGILTSRGGLVSHAAVVARGWGKPAVVGAEAVVVTGRAATIAGHGVAEGDWLSIDGGTGRDHARRGRRSRAATAPEGADDDPVVGRRDPQGPPRGAGERRHRADDAAPRAGSAPRGSGCAVPSTCSSPRTGSRSCAG